MSYMKNTISKKHGVVAAACMLLLVMFLAGCTAPQNEQPATTSENAPSNNEYMAQINTSVNELNERLQSFNDAVSRNDIVGMRTQADNAAAVLDKMAAIEAPEELTDLRADYVKGCDQLKMALSSYVSLYTEIATATDAAPFDYSTYADRIEAVQSQYDEGVQTLEDADKSATEL